jgi:hypothetical protein
VYLISCFIFCFTFYRSLELFLFDEASNLRQLGPLFVMSPLSVFTVLPSGLPLMGHPLNAHWTVGLPQ